MIEGSAFVLDWLFFHFKLSGEQWPVKTIYLMSDDSSLTNNITFAFLFFQ